MASDERRWWERAAEFAGVAFMLAFVAIFAVIVLGAVLMVACPVVYGGRNR